MDVKEQLDSLLISNYDYFLKVSHNITSRQRSSSDQKYNLLHEVIISLYSRLDSHHAYLKSETDFRKYINKYLKQYYVWQRNVKHRTQKDNSLFTYQAPLECENNEMYEVVDYKSEEMIYIDAENTDEITKMFLKDLSSNDVSTEKGLLVNKIQAVAKNILTKEEHDFFDCYFLQEMTTWDIYNLYKNENITINETTRKQKGKAYPSYSTLNKYRKDIHKKIIDALTC